MSNGYKNGAFALGLVTGGGIVLNLFLWLDYLARNEIKTKPNTSQETPNSEIGRYWDGLLGTFVSPSDTLAQWVMAVFTIAATVVLVLTLRSANKTNRAAVDAATAAIDANEVMRYDQRPWLFVQSVTNDTISAEVANGPVSMIVFKFSGTYIIRNSGKTPALDVMIETANICQPSGAMPAEFIDMTSGLIIGRLKEQNSTTKKMTIPPGSSTRGHYSFAGMIPKAEISERTQITAILNIGVVYSAYARTEVYSTTHATAIKKRQTSDMMPDMYSDIDVMDILNSRQIELSYWSVGNDEMN